MTLLGLGGVRGEPQLNLGMMGMHGEAWVNTAIQEADLLLAFGMRFDDRVTGNLKTYAPHAKKIHVDIDPAEINKNVRVDVALVGDLREVLVELAPHVAGDRARRVAGAHQRAEGRFGRARHPEPARQRAPVCRARHQRHLARDRRQRDCRHRRRPAPDVGSAVLQAQHAALAHHQRAAWARWALRCRPPSARRSPSPDAEVWVVVGDGGFQMTMCELATVMQENIDINVAIINNGFLGMVRQWQEFFYEKRYAATPLVNPNFTKLAEAFGMTGIAVTKRGEVVPAVRTRAQSQGRRRHRLPGGTGRLGVPDGAGRRGPARDDPAAEPDCGDRGRRVNGASRRDTEPRRARSHTARLTLRGFCVSCHRVLSSRPY